MPTFRNFIPQGVTLDDTFLGSLLPWKGRNNPYISQPNIYPQALNLDLKERYVSIAGQEREIFLTTSPLRIVGNRLATMYANGRWIHLNKKGEPYEKSEALDRCTHPNVMFSGKRALYQYMIQRCVYGNIFEYQFRGSRLEEIPRAVWNMSPSRMVVNRNNTNIWEALKIEELIKSYTFKNYGTRADMIIDPRDIIQYSLPDSDDPIMSQSPLIGVRMEISNIRAAMGFRNVILTKRGAIGAWSSAAKDATGSISLRPDEEAKLVREAQRMYGIGDEQLAFMISSKELKWTSAIFETNKLELFTEVDANKRAIIDLWGANDNMFARPAKGNGQTFTNVEMGEQLCYQDTIIPIAEEHAEKRSERWGLTAKGEKLILSYDHLPILQKDKKKEAEVAYIKAQAYNLYLTSGLNKAEAAAEVGIEEPASGLPPAPAPAKPAPGK